MGLWERYEDIRYISLYIMKNEDTTRISTINYSAVGRIPSSPKNILFYAFALLSTVQIPVFVAS